MGKARGVFWLCSGVALIGLAGTGAALLVALSRVEFALGSVSGLAVACRRWMVADGGTASTLVLLLGALGLAALVLTARSALRQARATRGLERRLAVVGRLPEAPMVRLVRDAAPHAFCVGLVRPRIYLSTGALPLLDDRELRAVLEHERHHARRRDPLRLLVARALGDGLFFMPAIRRLAVRFAALIELAADEAAIRAAGHDPQPLASALLTFGSHPDPAVVGIAPERVDQLAGERTGWELPLVLLAGAGVTVLALGAVTVRLAESASVASIGLPALLAQACMLVMALGPVLAGVAVVLAARRATRR